MTTDGLDDVQLSREDVSMASIAASQQRLAALPDKYHEAIVKMEQEIKSLEAQREGLQRELKDSHEVVHQSLKLLAHLIKALT